MKNDQSLKVNYLIVVCLAVVFGLGSGISGGLITRSYIINDIYSIPFFGKLDTSSVQNARSNIIMDSAKNITIQQDDRVRDIINTAGQSIVGVFKKINTAKQEQSDVFLRENYYKINNDIADGLIVTSDGWVLVNGFLGNFADKYITENYVIINRERVVYEIDEVSRSEDDSFIFLKLKEAKDLPVRQFIYEQDLSQGQSVVALNWNNINHLTSIAGINKNIGEIKFSDEVVSEIEFSDNLDDFFDRSFIFDLNGNVIALHNDNQKIKSSQYFNPLIKNLLKKEDKARLALGINYVDLSDYAGAKPYLVNRGALIYPNVSGVSVFKDSKAEQAGLVEGDIIVSVNNMEINKNQNLSDLISQYLEDDEINLVYLRNGTENRIKIKMSTY